MSGFLSNLAKALAKTEVDIQFNLGSNDPECSNRPPYYNPSYPSYPGPAGGSFPAYPAREAWQPPPPPPSYGQSVCPGPPGPPVAPMYPALHPGGIDSSGRPLCTPLSFTAHVHPARRMSQPDCKPNIHNRPYIEHQIHTRSIFPGQSYTVHSKIPAFNGPYIGPYIHNCSIYPGQRYSVHVKIPAFYDYGWAPPPHCTGSLRYVSSSSGHVPPGAVHGGQDKDGGPIFIGRAFHEGDLIPAKICPSHGCAFVGYDGKEITKMQYEVLCSEHVAWEYARDGECPPAAIKMGQTANGEPLFVGRTMIDGTMTPGKVHPSHGVLYIPFNGMELSFPQYEILILT